VRTTADCGASKSFFEKGAPLRWPVGVPDPALRVAPTLYSKRVHAAEMPSFLGLEAPPAPPTTTCHKKSSALPDIDEVGLDIFHTSPSFRDARQLLVFGPVFKECAIESAT